MSHELLKQVVKETSGSLFMMSVNDFGQWKIYIYKSKKMFVGELETVCKQAAEEFLQNRVLNTSQNFRFKARKYSYAPVFEPKSESKIATESCNGSYNEKLKFAKQLGFNNVAMAISNLGALRFNDQYNKMRIKL
jgi:hypothetical protein